MAESSNIISLDSDDDCDYAKDKQPEKEVMECPICLQTCIHPARLPCGHIFCFLCVKGVAYKNRRCAMCRREIPTEFLDHPQLVYGVQESHSITEDGYQWFYEGRNGWWQYDERTCQDIEEAYKKGDKFCTILVAGYVYVVDFESMLQQRQNDPSRKRQVKRDLATIPKKGVAGLRIDGSGCVNSNITDLTNTTSSDDNLINNATLTHNRIFNMASVTTGGSSSMIGNNLISTIVATDAAVRIASDIIDSTLAHADEYRNEQTDQLDNVSTITVNSIGINSNSNGSTNINNDEPNDLLSIVYSSPSERCDLLEQVEETLNITNVQSINSPSNLEDFFSLTIDEFRSLALSNIAETSSDSDSDDDNDDIHVNKNLIGNRENDDDDDDDEDDDDNGCSSVIL